MQNIIPALNGTQEDLTGKFKIPNSFVMDGMFPAVDEVFAQRMNMVGNHEICNQGKEIISLKLSEKYEEEEYRLLVCDDKVEVFAKGEKGYSNGLVTLYQMLVMGNGEVSCCDITDKPRYAKRGLMLDNCRHLFPMEEIKKILDQMSLLKLNEFHWHLTDDQGFRIESKRFPELNTISSYRHVSPQDPLVERGKMNAGDMYGGYYTQEEIRDVISYAAARQIDVVPEIEMPGHGSAILAAFPQFSCTGEPLKVKGTFGVHERIFCAGNEEVYPFLYELLDEVCELFSSKYIHIGGDEAPISSWKKCPHCNALMQNEGFANYEKLQTFFSGKIIDYLKKKGKIAVVWNESAISGDLDNTAVIQYWAEMAPGESYVVPEFKKGRKLILSSSNYFYCTPSYADLPLKATLMYEPEVKGVRVPRENVLGIETAMWTEWSCENSDIEKAYYPRLLAVAECGWTENRSYENFMTRAKRYLEYDALNLLEATPWDEATVSGEKALEMIADGMLSMGAKYKGMAEWGNEEGGKAEATVPEGTVPIDAATMTRSFVKDKMKATYSEEQIEAVIEMIMKKMSDRG